MKTGTRLKIITIVALATMLAVVVPSSASTVPYTTEASFVAALQPGYYLEEFDAYALIDGPLGEYLDFSGPVPANGFKYRVTAPIGGLWAGDSALSTANNGDPLTITFTGLPVMAVGARFFATTGVGHPTTAAVHVIMEDGTTKVVNQEISAAFAGFSVTSGEIKSVTIRGPGGNAYPTVDHLYVGRIGLAIPTPTAAFGGIGMLAALAGFGIFRRRMA